jgi:hypothetical protein
MNQRRNAIIWASVIAGLCVWVLFASLAYTWVGGALASFAHMMTGADPTPPPLHLWFYWLWPLPDRFLWDGLALLLSAVMATLPFLIVARQLWDRRKARGQKIYGESQFADRKQMTKGGITSKRSV